MAFIFAKPLLSIYITDSEEAIVWGIIRMGFICLPYFLCGTMDVASGAVRGMGASISPMIIVLLGACGIRIGWIYTVFQLESLHTPQVLYLSYPISWTLTFIALLITFSIIYKKLKNEKRLS